MMKRWMTSSEITRLYRVSVVKLDQFAARGNLGIKKDGLGQFLYDAQVVACLFPCRDVMLNLGAHDSMGSLGDVRLAEGQHISVTSTRFPVQIPIPRFQRA